MNSSMRLDSNKTQMISLDMRNRTLKAFVPAPPAYAEDTRPYFPCELSNYLTYTLELPKVIQARNRENVTEDLPQMVPRDKKRKLAGNTLYPDHF
jgi:hypothetical protein